MLLLVRLEHEEFFLEVRAAAQPAVDLDVAELGLHLGAAPEPEGDHGQDQPDAGDDQADDHRGRPEVEHVQRLARVGERGDEHADDDQRDGPARERLPARFGGDVELDVHLVGQDRAELAQALVADSQPLDDLAQDGQGVRRRVAGGERGDLVAHLDGLPVALVALLGGIAFGDESLRLAGLLEEGAALGERGLGLGPSLAGGRQAVPVALELGEGQVALLHARRGLGDGLLGDLQAAGVLVALGRQVVDGPVELAPGVAGPAVRAADRGLQPVPEGGLVAGEPGEFQVADGAGRPEEALGRDPGELGDDLVGERRVRDRLPVVLQVDRALRAGEGLLERARARAVLLVLVEVDRRRP